MPLDWDDEEEDLTELDYRKRTSKVLVHDEITTVLEQPKASKDQTPLVKSPQNPTAPKSITTHMGLRPAPVRDRFVAFAIDSILAFYAYFLIGYSLKKFFNIASLHVLHQSPGRLSLHIAITIALSLFYYLFMESVFGATLGKFFCRLRVVEEHQARPSLGNIFIRNLLRLVDYPLAFLIAVITMESSPLNQRLGDRAAKTVVIKKTRAITTKVNLQHTPLASTLSRLLAGIIDLGLAFAFAYSFLLLSHDQYPLYTLMISLSAPFAFLFYFVLLEFLTGTTPGKVLFRRHVVLSHGEPLDGPAAFLRNLFRPIDYFIGYPLIVLSPKQQRLGDMIADTLVVVKSGTKKAVISTIAAIFIILALAYVGYNNSHSLVRQSGQTPLQGIQTLLNYATGIIDPKHRITPTNKSIIKKPTSPKNTTAPKILPQSTSQTLKVANFNFATGPQPNQIRKNHEFFKQDPIYMFFKIQGFKKSAQEEASLSEDLRVVDPQGKTILTKPQLLRINKKIKKDTQNILFANHIKLPKDSPKGNYQAYFTIYDHVAKTQYTFQRNFSLK